MTEWGKSMPKRTVHRSRQLSAESIVKLHVAFRELHGMGFHGRAATSKPYITTCNAKHWMQWCKARRNWT
ncbi:unnamed protein product, partial [Staurois parvus]